MTTEAQLRPAPASTRVEAAIAAIANGEFVVVLDHEDRENEAISSWPRNWSLRRPWPS
jgi:hypothetical protein